MPFTGLFNAPPVGGSQRGNGINGTGVPTAQGMGLPNGNTMQGVQGSVSHDMVSGARKRQRDISFGKSSGYGGLETSSSVGDKITMMIRQDQIEIGRLIEENAKKLRMEIAVRQAQQAKQLVAAVREENSEKLKYKDDEMWRMGKNNYFLQQKVNSLIEQNRYLMNLATTHQATIGSLQAQLVEVLESEQRLLDANVAAQGAESCCDSNNINAEVDLANVVPIDRGADDVGNGSYIMNQGDYVDGGCDYNMNECGFGVGGGGYIMDEGALENIKNII